ncbi:hypothetical protein C349_06058 [Cryptococcus neoformans var. grubii Br795]|nr:hypothetical protein C349_06058 [Cryptococcus neoformans var. grubii Br795]
MAAPPTWIKRPVHYFKSLFDNHERAAKGIARFPHQEKTEPDPEIVFMREVCRKERLDLLGRHKDYTEFDLRLCMDTLLSRDTSQQQIIQKKMESRMKRVRREHAGSEKGKLGAISSIWNEASDFSRMNTKENKEFTACGAHIAAGLTRHLQATRAPLTHLGVADGPRNDYPSTTHSCPKSKAHDVTTKDIEFRPKKKLKTRYAPSTLSSSERLLDLLIDAQNDLERHEEERKQWAKSGTRCVHATRPRTRI